MAQAGSSPARAREWASPDNAFIQSVQLWVYNAFVLPCHFAFFSGLKAYVPVLPGGSDLAGARGDTILPHSIATLFEHLVVDAAANRREFDTQLDTFSVLAEPSAQHSAERSLYKAVFPTNPRDFVTFSGWEATPDGGFLIYATSVLRDDAPPVKGCVRGSLDIGGWIVQPLSEKELSEAQSSGLGPKGAVFKSSAEACRVCRLFRTSIGGGVPVIFIRSATAAQAQVPLVLHKNILKRIATKGPFRNVRVCNIASALPAPAATASVQKSPSADSLSLAEATSALVAAATRETASASTAVVGASMPLESATAPVDAPALPLEKIPSNMMPQSESACVAITSAEPVVASSAMPRKSVLELIDVSPGVITPGSSPIEPAEAMSPSVAVTPAVNSVCSNSSSAAVTSFIPPPVLAPPYEEVRAAAMKKIHQLFEDAFTPEGPQCWKFTGQTT